MAKRIKPPRPSRSSETPRGRQVRDPLTRLLLFCELMALGLVAASIYLKFPRELPRPDVPEATAGHFPTLLGKASFIAVHTRTPWVTLAVVSLVAAVVAYQSRRKPARSRIVALAPAVILLVVTLHAAGQGWLQSHGDLVFEHREGGNSERIQELPATMAGSGPGTSTAPAAERPAEPARVAIEVMSIRRFIVKENQPSQWLGLLGGDLLFSVPALFAWVLSFRPNKLAVNERP